MWHHLPALTLTAPLMTCVIRAPEDPHRSGYHGNDLGNHQPPSPLSHVSLTHAVLFTAVKARIDILLNGVWLKVWEGMGVAYWGRGE